MTRKEVIDLLTAKFEANQDELRRQLEVIVNIPGPSINVGVENLFAKLSSTFKEGQAMRELMIEFVPMLYPDTAQQAPEARPS